MKLLSGLFDTLPPLPSGDTSSPNGDTKAAGDGPPPVRLVEDPGAFMESLRDGGGDETTPESPVCCDSKKTTVSQTRSTPYLTAHTASPEWRQARDRYIGHLMACPSCYAPVGHYCATGDHLRQRYNDTPMAP